jgi:hypothetical protein
MDSAVAELATALGVSVEFVFSTVTKAILLKRVIALFEWVAFSTIAYYPLKMAWIKANKEVKSYDEDMQTIFKGIVMLLALIGPFVIIDAIGDVFIAYTQPEYAALQHIANLITPIN